MKKILSIILMALMAFTLMAQSSEKTTRRIKIRSADPYYIMMMLSGQMVWQPEFSTIFKTQSFGQGGGFGNGGFGGNNNSTGNNFGGNNNFGQGRGSENQGGFGQGRGGGR